mgnify:CR=1 FL=1
MKILRSRIMIRIRTSRPKWPCDPPEKLTVRVVAVCTHQAKMILIGAFSACLNFLACIFRYVVGAR